MKGFVKTSQAEKLLHNKFVLVLGGSVQRSMYKDLVRLLHTDNFLTYPQLKSKGELSFESDRLIEGGCLGVMSNGIDYREVRQYHSDHHLLRFYFITRVYSSYMQTILEDLRHGLKPDLIIVSSCLWDMTRYGLDCLENYKKNLHRFFGQIKRVVCHDCLVIWALAMPLAKQIKGGFLVSEVRHLGSSLSTDIIEANFYSGHLADSHGLDILDLHFHFRLSLQHRTPDGVHWDAVAHRTISSILLLHAAQAWGVLLKDESVASTPLLLTPTNAGSVGSTGAVNKKTNHWKDKVKWFPPPSPPSPPPRSWMAPRHVPWRPRFRHPGAPLFWPRQLFLRSGLRTSLCFRPEHLSHVPDRRPPPEEWGHWSREGCVRWRRPCHRMHPYDRSGHPGPRRPMWGW